MWQSSFLSTNLNNLNNSKDNTTIRYEESDKIGSGGFATVFRGKFVKIPFFTDVAVKRVQLADLRPQGQGEEVLLNLFHPNVVKLLHYEDQDSFR